MLQDALDGYIAFLNCVCQGDSPKNILAKFNQFQILCALREGPFGVVGLNESFEKILLKRCKINYHPLLRWYEGRPIIILRNDSVLGLFNGDIGIALNRGNGLRIWFCRPDGSMKSVSPNRLPEHETAWAMTVHKSQGSEFEHIALILPINITPILTRELIYTAVTRARKYLSLYVNDQVLIHAIMTRTERHSGLNFIFESTT